MTVGESLTEARNQAGLSVDELSERTRIRETVIASIERDDYGACGGDLYVRGYVRAIAGAVGIDARPLICEYDAGRAATTIGGFEALGADAAATRFDLPPVRENELPPFAGDAAGVLARRLTAVAFAIVLVIAGVASVVGVRLASPSTPSRNTAATSVPPTATSSATAGASAAGRPKPSTHARPATSTGARRSSVRLPVTALPIAAAEAFGPDGLADGDNPVNAHNAIAGDAPLPWSTQWYTTPEFGRLKHGTGLLLDLGRQVTITSVRLDLSQYQGANLELRIGDTTSPGDFTVAATDSGTGGVVRLTLPHPASARYLLVWFTLLPSDGAGHYQESVSGVRVNGRRA